VIRQERGNWSGGNLIRNSRNKLYRRFVTDNIVTFQSSLFGILLCVSMMREGSVSVGLLPFAQGQSRMSPTPRSMSVGQMKMSEKRILSAG